MRALQFSEFGPVSNLRLIELPDPKAENGRKKVPVKIGISDDNFWEITDGLKEGDEIVVGGFKAIGRDLDDGKKIVKNAVGLATK